MGKHVIMDIISISPHEDLFKMNVDMLVPFLLDWESILGTPCFSMILKSCTLFLISDINLAMSLIFNGWLLNVDHDIS